MAAYELTRFIVISTLAIEAVGALLLALSYHYHYGYEPLEALWRGGFHSVSAFCNAGFSLWSDSLIQFQRDAFVQGVHMARIMLGGLGFSVLAALWMSARGVPRRWSLQTRIVLIMSLGLIVGGWALYAMTEWEASLGGFAASDKLLNALFQSVSLRTAGFNSVDYAGLEGATILMVVVWMFVGASPGSTGGGIKTTTLAVMLAGLPALIRNQPRAMLMRRTIPYDIVYRAATIMTVATMVAVVGIFLLLATHVEVSFGKGAFVGVSALVLAAEQLHDEEGHPLGLAKVEDLHGVGVVQLGDRLGLAAKALHNLTVTREVAMKELHRHQAVRPRAQRPDAALQVQAGAGAVPADHPPQRDPPVRHRLAQRRALHHDGAARWRRPVRPAGEGPRSAA